MYGMVFLELNAFIPLMPKDAASTMTQIMRLYILFILCAYLIRSISCIHHKTKGQPIKKAIVYLQHINIVRL